MTNWIKTSEQLPTQDGEYLVAERILGLDYTIYDTVYWAANLHMVDEYGFEGEKYNRSGFYDYDSEWGYVERTNVVAWQPIEEYIEE